MNSLTPTEWLTLALVIITAFYAWATLRILKSNQASVAAMNAQLEAQQRPYVTLVATVRPGTTLICLELLNTGKSAATDVRLRLSENYLFNGEEGGRNLAEAPAFTRPIASVSSGTRLVYLLGMGSNVLGRSDARCPMVFTVNATYKFGAHSYTEDHVVDLHPMIQATAVPDPLVDQLKEVTKEIKGLTQTVAGLNLPKTSS